jgi:hypothetical protein
VYRPFLVSYGPPLFGYGAPDTGEYKLVDFVYLGLEILTANTELY